MKRILRDILYFLICIILFALLTSCRTTKREKISQKQKETIEQQNNIDIHKSQDLYTEIEKIIHCALSEEINATQKETEYDTDKPINTETGKHPIKREKETSWKKKSNESTEQTEQSSVNQKNAETIKDQSTVVSKSDIDITAELEQHKQKEYNIFLKWVGGITIFLAASGLILYILGKYLKKK